MEAGKGAPKTRSIPCLKIDTLITIIGIDIGKNSFHVVSLDARRPSFLGRRWSRGQAKERLANQDLCKTPTVR
jgi:hypothetical protein